MSVKCCGFAVVEMEAMQTKTGGGRYVGKQVSWTIAMEIKEGEVTSMVALGEQGVERWCVGIERFNKYVYQPNLLENVYNYSIVFVKYVILNTRLCKCAYSVDCLCGGVTCGW